MEKIDDNDEKIISEIKEIFSEIDSKLNNIDNKTDYEIKEYFLINKVWIEKYFSITKKEKIFKDLIYFILRKIPLHSKKYLFRHNENNYLYFNNFKLIPKNILSYFLSIINNNKNESEKDINLKKYNLTKIIFKSSKIILVLEENLCLEILNKNIIPEYLLCFKNNQHINIQQMIKIFIEEMKMEIPDKEKSDAVYDIETGKGIKITVINLGKIIEEEKSINIKMSEDNCNKMNQLWENKYKNKIDKHLDEIANKYNYNFQKQMNLNNEIIKEKLKTQNEEQNKIFTNNYNNIINQINDSKSEINDKDNENKISLILDNYIKKDNNNNKDIINNNNEKKFNDFLIIDEANGLNSINMDSNEPLNEEKINLIIAPTLFFLSNINPLIEYFIEKKESIQLYKFVEENCLLAIISEFVENIKNSKEEIKDSLNKIYLNYSHLIINSMLIKDNNLLNKINSPGNMLSYILQTLDMEQNKYNQLFNEQSIIDLNINNNKKENDIYNDEEMFKEYIDNSIKQKSFIYQKFHIIIKSSKLCKECNKRSYVYGSSPTLNIYLNKSSPIVTENFEDDEMYNALMCRINFPENISQLISPSYMSKKTEFCKNCKKYNEIIYNKNICILKNYLIVNVDRENDPKNEMIFIYPEILDLRKESNFIINLYQLTGVICKRINKGNYNIDEVEKDISHYICYFRKEKENKWICFDDKFGINEVENNCNIYNFKGVSALLYSKKEN